MDGSGNLIITGQYQDTASFGTSSMTSAGSYDIFLVKLSGTNGSVIWKKSIGGTGIDMGNVVALDGSGNIVLTGSFRGAVDFGGGSVANTNPYNLPFLAKYSALDGVLPVGEAVREDGRRAEHPGEHHGARRSTPRATSRSPARSAARWTSAAAPW